MKTLDETSWLQAISDKENSGNKPNAIVAYEDLTSNNLNRIWKIKKK